MKKMIAVVVLLTGCAAAKPKIPAAVACQNAPQWFTNDAQGKPSNAVFVCFGEDGVLLYRSRPLTPAEISAMTTPAAAPVAATTPKKKAAAK